MGMDFRGYKSFYRIVIDRYPLILLPTYVSTGVPWRFEMQATKSVYQNHPGYVLVPRGAVEDLVNSLGPQTVQAIRNPPEFDPEVFLTEFRDACQIDYHLRSLTIKYHMRHAKRLLDFLGKHPLYATRQELRRFLMFNQAQNAIKAVRVLYGKFLKSDLASCFKVYQRIPHPIIVPNRAQIRETYENLETAELRAMFLLLASSGKRIHEAAELTPEKIDLEKRMIIPNQNIGRTKFQWISFFNDEAKAALEKMFDEWFPLPGRKMFTLHQDSFSRKFRKASRPTGFKITSQILREWFCNEMGRLGVQDRYVDAFCGRVPKKILAMHYTDYSPERLKEIYDKADLKVL